ncbi:MAG: OsmC family protein [Vicinamibacterales bacterium]
MAPKPPTVIDLTWTGDLAFVATTSQSTIAVDSGGASGTSPVELLGVALAGCMSVDLAHILGRGRHAFRSLRSRLVAQRDTAQPHRFVAVSLHFAIEGDVPQEAVARAITLSRDKYCSVWHTLRQDIDLQVTFDVTP